MGKGRWRKRRGVRRFIRMSCEMGGFLYVHIDCRRRLESVVCDYGGLRDSLSLRF